MTFNDYLALCNELGLVSKDGIALFNNKAIATFWFYNINEYDGKILIISDNYSFLNNCKEIDDAKQKMLERIKKN